MEEIMAIKKNLLNNPIITKELLNDISKIKAETEKFKQKVEEKESKFLSISNDKETIKNDFESEKQRHENTKIDFENQTKILENVKEEKEKLEIEVQGLEVKQQNLKKTKRSLKDEQTLERGKRKFQLYKEYTGIRWDLAAPESKVQGIITDKKDYLHKFSYKADLDISELRNLLWKEIKTMATSSQNDENNFNGN